ncbi:MAG: amino acid transporter [Silicimonas sp.]|nr:amino acid transporter [Silicimonas sp.]
MTAFVAGFALSLSLILAIGAQNAFVLRQGIRRAHVGLVVATCILSEAVLIFSGVAGFGALMERVPALEPITRWGGAAFILGYGLLSLKRAFQANDALEAASSQAQSAKGALMTCLALTWLNPHVYLDTLILIGAVAAQYGADRWLFGWGALAASTVFFVILGYGARGLQPVFAKPSAWRVLDAGVGVLMICLAVAVAMA